MSREKLWKVLDEYGVKGKLLKVIQELYVDGKARVKVGGVYRIRTVWCAQRSETGLCCTLSPWLFNVFMDKVTRDTKRQFQSEVNDSMNKIIKQTERMNKLRLK